MRVEVDAKKILYDIVNAQGEGIYTELGKLKAMLRDLRVDKLQANLLVEIAKASYFRSFTTKVTASNIEIEKRMLAESVRDDYDFDESYVLWGVECWAQAVFRNNLWANKKKLARYMTDAPDFGSGGAGVTAYDAAVKVSLGQAEAKPQKPSAPPALDKTAPVHADMDYTPTPEPFHYPPLTPAYQPADAAQPLLEQADQKEEKEMFTRVASLTLKDVMEEQQKIQKTLKRAEDGDANYRYLLGEMYELGKGVNPNFRKALKWYKLSAMQGNVQAMFRLGQIYEQGKFLPVNYEEALRWYKAAKDKGNEHAVNRYKQIKRRLRGLF